MTYLNQLQIGDIFNGTYYLESASEKTASNGKSYCEMFIRDKTGVRKALCFNDPLPFLNEIKNGNKNRFVSVSGSCDEYKGNPSIILDAVCFTATPQDLSDYIRAFSKDDIDHDWRFISETLKMILANPSIPDKCLIIPQIVQECFLNKKFISAKFNAPMGTGHHYGCIGGWVSFTANLVRLAMQSAIIYGLTGEEETIIQCAALCAKCGCVFAYYFEGCAPCATYNGEMLGDATLTTIMLQQAIREAKKNAQSMNVECDDSCIGRFMHCVLACNGIVPPKTKEALALQSVISSHLAAMDCVDFIEDDTTAGQFTAFSPKHDRRFLKSEV